MVTFVLCMYTLLVLCSVEWQRRRGSSFCLQNALEECMIGTRRRETELMFSGEHACSSSLVVQNAWQKS